MEIQVTPQNSLKITKREALSILAERACSCTRCPDLVASRDKVVFGEGSPGARLAIIGEAPGATESREGRPFCGPSGKLLDETLLANGVSRDQVYICNILKCHPEWNRDPTPEEASNCRGFLEMQIRVVDPDAILCLGGVAAKTLLETEVPVSRLRNVWHDCRIGGKSRKLRVAFHPSYLLRNRTKVQLLIDDVAEALRGPASVTGPPPAPLITA